MAAIPNAASSSSTGNQKSPPTFEFTKRKRWADLLVTELADSIILVLSPTAQILYVGPAVSQILGWKETELIDCNLVDILNDQDQTSFRTNFSQSARSGSDMLTHVRMKCFTRPGSTSSVAPKSEVLVEVKGYPHFVSPGDEECECFIAMATPFPSRNGATLATLAELKVEHERLQARLLSWKIQAQNSSHSSSPASSSSSLSNAHASSSLYATSSMVPAPQQGHAGSNAPLPPPQRAPEPSNYYYTSNTAPPGRYEDATRTAVKSNSDHGGGYNAGHTYGASPAEEEGLEEGTKKKKLKKSHPSEHHVCVTCGRTDSPEWRKGPLGPKTLCNACGLRWAKQMRKTDDLGQESLVLANEIALG